MHLGTLFKQYITFKTIAKGQNAMVLLFFTIVI